MLWRGGLHWTAYAEATTWPVHRSGAGRSRAKAFGSNRPPDFLPAILDVSPLNVVP
jgi:hypothetical protein